MHNKKRQTGVLPLLFGRATKACDILPDGTKRYTAGFRFGTVTDTQDITGSVTASSDAPVSEEALRAALPRFTGSLEQIPPMYSAVQVNGQRLYDIARQGREVEREARQVEIASLELLCYNEEKHERVCFPGRFVAVIIQVSQGKNPPFAIRPQFPSSQKHVSQQLQSCVKTPLGHSVTFHQKRG